MVNIAFDRRDLKEDRQALDAMYMRDFYMDIATKVGWVLLILIAVLYFRKKARKLFAALGQILPPPKPTRPEPARSTTGDEEEEEDVKPLKPERRKPKLVERMQETAKEQPEEIAKVIKTMMAE
jgi:flagellar biosynthesis/type III secretory pathway M-ring protein FliF/YscJ